MALDLFSCMRGFAMVAECEGFAPAARKLHISPPVLTKQIQFLEHHVKKPLLERTTRQVRLTEAGGLYLQQVQKVLRELTVADHILSDIDTEPHGTLKLGFGGYLNMPSVVNQLKQFSDRYPKIMLDVRMEIDPVLVLNGELDLGIGHAFNQESALVYEHLFDAHRRLYASPGYLKKNGTPKTLEDLKHHDCLVYHTSSPNGEWVFGKNKKLKVKGRYMANGSGHFALAVQAGFGIAWMMDYLVVDQVEKGLLQEIFLDIKMPAMPVYLYYRPQVHNQALRQMIEHLKKEVFTTPS